MGSNHAPVDVMELPVQLPLGVRLALELSEHPVPHARLDPSVEAGGDTPPGTVLGGKVAPGCSGAVDPKDGVHDGAMILARATGPGLLGWQEGLQPLPLLVSQYVSRAMLGV